jgi:hypothetical protein
LSETGNVVGFDVPVGCLTVGFTVVWTGLLVGFGVGFLVVGFVVGRGVALVVGVLVGSGVEEGLSGMIDGAGVPFVVGLAAVGVEVPDAVGVAAVGSVVPFVVGLAVGMSLVGLAAVGVEVPDAVGVAAVGPVVPFVVGLAVGMSIVALAAVGAGVPFVVGLAAEGADVPDVVGPVGLVVVAAAGALVGLLVADPAKSFMSIDSPSTSPISTTTGVQNCSPAPWASNAASVVHPWFERYLAHRTSTSAANSKPIYNSQSSQLPGLYPNAQALSLSVSNALAGIKSGPPSPVAIGVPVAESIFPVVQSELE